MNLITRNGGRRIDCARDEAPQFRTCPPGDCAGPCLQGRRSCTGKPIPRNNEFTLTHAWRWCVNEIRWLIEFASKATLFAICVGLWAGITARLFLTEENYEHRTDGARSSDLYRHC